MNFAKKIHVLALAIMFLLWSFSLSNSDTYWRTYEVIAISNNSLTLADSDGTQIVVHKEDTKDYKVGYNVRYDDVRDVLKKDRWQDYTVREVSNNSIILEHKTGDELKLESGELKTSLDKFKKNDKVSYDAVGEHLKAIDKLN